VWATNSPASAQPHRNGKASDLLLRSFYDSTSRSHREEFRKDLAFLYKESSEAPLLSSILPYQAVYTNETLSGAMSPTVYSSELYHDFYSEGVDLDGGGLRPSSFFSSKLFFTEYEGFLPGLLSFPVVDMCWSEYELVHDPLAFGRLGDRISMAIYEPILSTTASFPPVFNDSYSFSSDTAINGSNFIDQPDNSMILSS
jgi:hypothetical protein